MGHTLLFYRRRREQILYLLVGAWNTLFGYGLWALMEYLLHEYFHYLVILILSWPIAVLNAYICYRIFVFHSKGSVWRELPRFSLVYVVTLCAALLALPALLHALPFNIYVIQAGYTAVVVVLSYLSHKFFSFGGNRKRAVVSDGKRPG
jgi:putative flippase GtrA